MFNPRYFNPRYFNPRYFAEFGANPAVVTGPPTGGVEAISGGAAKTLTHVALSLTANGVVAAAVPGRRLKCCNYSLQSRNDGMSLQLTDGNGGVNLTHIWTLNARDAACPAGVPPNAFLFASSQGNPIFAVITGGGTIDLDLGYWPDDAS